MENSTKSLIIVLGISAILILVLFALSNPSLTGFVSKDLDKVKVKELKLNQICADDGGSIWRVHNTNKFSLNYTWQIENTSLNGQGIAVEGKSYFSVSALVEDYRILLFVDQVLQDSKLYSDKCEVDEDYVVPEINISINETIENITIIEINETNLTDINNTEINNTQINNTVETNLTFEINLTEDDIIENITDSNITLTEINASSNDTIENITITEIISQTSSSGGGGSGGSSSSSGGSSSQIILKPNLTQTNTSSNVQTSFESNITSNLEVVEKSSNFFTLAGNAVRLLEDGKPNYYVIIPLLFFLTGIAIYFIVRTIKKRKNKV